MTVTVVTAIINSISNTIAAIAPNDNLFFSSVPEIGSKIDINCIFLIQITHNLIL